MAPGLAPWLPISRSRWLRASLPGRTLSGLLADALVAVSDRTEAAHHTPLAPLTAFGNARAQQQLDRRDSTIGVIATGVERRFAPDDPLAKLLPATAFVGGADWNLRLGDVDSALSGDVAASRGRRLGALRRYWGSNQRGFGGDDAE
jgi:hypothetical protein